MNDDLESSSAAQPLPDHDPDEDAAEGAATAAQLAERRKRNRDMYNRKRGDLLDDLRNQLDMLIYAQLSAIYYMDCYFYQFVIRAFVQLVFLTPKPPGFPEPPGRPYVGTILGSTIFCLLMHIFRDAPSAGEATRGYLHGGLAMDFIGQKGPSSKIHLVLLDLLVLVLQITHLSAHVLRQRLKDSLAVPLPNLELVANTATATSTLPEAPHVGSPPIATSHGQSLDDEERGIRRSNEQRDREDIEMQTLNPSGSANRSRGVGSELEASERDTLLASTATRAANEAHMFDAFSSGQIVIADLNLPRTVKEQLVAFQKAPGPSSRIDFRANRAVGERLAGQILRWRFGGGAGGGGGDQTLGA